MKIALFLPSLGAGGAERVMSMLANHWANAGHRVDLVMLAAADAPIHFELDQRIGRHHLGLLRPSRGPIDAAFANTQRIRALRRKLIQLQPDIALAFLPEMSALVALAASGLGIPLILSERNAPGRQRLAGFWRLLRDRAYRRAEAVVFQTERARAAVTGRIDMRSLVIPNPVHCPAAAPGPIDVSVIIAAGRLVPQKGFDLLIEAFATLRTIGQSWVLEIWGEGPERSRLERLIEAAGLGDRVRLAGVASTPDEWLRRGSIFALSSRFEGFPNVLLEAMAGGRAVVATDCPFGPAEIIDHGRDGWLVPSQDVGAMADALQRLIDDGSLRQRLGTAASQSVRRFAADTIAEEWDRLLNRTLDRHAT